MFLISLASKLLKLFLVNPIQIGLGEHGEACLPVVGFLLVELLTVDLAFSVGVKDSVIAIAHVFLPGQFSEG